MEEPKSLLHSKRLYIVILLFFNNVINYVDRINLSVAAPELTKQFGWDPGTMGLIFSSFLWTYSIFLIPSGWFTDRYGLRKSGSISISLWSLSAMLTGAITSFGTMMASRLALGAGEAATYPVAGKAIRQWFPAKERGTATAIFHAGAYAGPAISTPIAAWLIVQTGWRASFFILGFLGFIWLFFWLKLYRLPEKCSWLSAGERDYIIQNRGDQLQSDAAEKAVSGNIIGKLLSQKTMWGLAITQGCAVYTNYLFLTWLPSYLVQSRGMQLMKAGIFSALPFLVAVILVIVFGRVSDKLLEGSQLKKGKRRNLVIAFMVLSSIVLLTTYVQNDILVLALISVSLSAISSAIALNIALTNDLVSSPRIIGTATGILVLGGNIFGLMAPIVTGLIVKTTGNFNSAFILAGVILLFGALVSMLLTRKPLVYEESDHSKSIAAG